MLKFRFLLCLVLSVALLFPLCLSGCNGNRPSEETTLDPQPDKVTESTTETSTTEKPVETSTTETTTPVPEKPQKPTELFMNTYLFTNNRGHFKRFGRMQELNDGITCDFTASGVEFCGVMKGDVTIELSCDRDTYFTVFVDGVRQEERFYATSATTELLIATFPEAGEHTIRFLKQTEVQWSLCVLKSVSFVGYLSPAPEDREFLIEFIGDSITCGYGNLGNPSTPVAGIASMQDGTQAFAFLTAEALNAEANIVACSGIGIAKGWTAMNEMEFYQKVSYYRDQEKAYEGNVRVPDLIVINLGTNDQDRWADQTAFQAGVKELIQYLRNLYGADVPIVWMYNMMTYGCFTWARPVLAELGGENAGIYTIQFTPNKQGAGNHPELAAHYAASEQLVKFIQDRKLLD